MARPKKQEKTEIESDLIQIIRNDLLNQLDEQQKYGKHFTDMVEDYIYFVKLKMKLQDDINKKGLRYRVKSGNGFSSSKPNESVQNLIKVNGQMLTILEKLELKAPDKER